jgi:hypothetical protein
MKPVFAKTTTAISSPHGGTITVPEGSHWSADDPIVTANPDLFSDDPRWGALFSQPLRPDQYPGAPVEDDEPPVERATAVPGELRHVDRGHRRAR